jgi:subtilase family serine protease
MSRSSLLSRSFASLVLFALSAVPSFSAVQARVVAPVSDSSRTAIPNSVHPRAKLASDLGPAPLDQKLQAMTIRFSLTAAQSAALDQLLLDQQDPTSPRYHQWLTPADYAAQFGLASSDIAKVTAWLTGEGLTVTGVANSGTFVTFDGTVAQVQAAFGTTIHTLRDNGVTHYANLTDPSVPAALGGVVMGITGLHDYRLKPRLKTRTVNPKFTSSVSGSHYTAPGDFYTIYNELPAFNSGINGSGVTIAVMGQIDVALSDITAFRSAAGLAALSPTTVHEGSDPGSGYNCSSSTSTNCPSPNLDDLGESDLDLEWSGAVAPAATILFVNGPDVLNNATTQAIDQNLAPIITVSYGNCEAAWGTTELNTLNQLFKQASAQGQTVVAPAGDSGATDCDGGPSATNGLAVDFPGSSPYVTSMGGSQFNEGSATYWSSTETTVTAGTAVPAATLSALSYIPEQPWNDASAGSFGGGGGGQSGYFVKPYWQTGSGVPADASRDTPDLSLNASDAHDGYLYCTDGSCVVGFRASTNGNLTVAGGTSFSTPTFAAILALVEQKTGQRIGNANPTIYALANNASYYTPGANFLNNSAVVFNDITSGNNSMACTGGTPNCPNGGSVGYTAANGYDLASGWGSINASNLVNAWAKVTPIAVSGPAGAATTIVTVSTSTSSIAAGGTVILTATVTGSGSTPPTGTMQFLINNTAVGSPVTLNNTVATYSFVTSCSTLGQQIVAASYSGDANYAGAKGSGIIAGENATAVTPIEFQVTTGTCPDFSITPASSAVTVASGGGTPSATVTIAPINGFTGTVTFTGTATSTSGYYPTLVFSPSTVTTSGSTTVTLSGITAQLHRPLLPGHDDGGTFLATHRTPQTPWYAAGSGVTIASLLLFTVPRRRRRLGGLMALALSIAMLGGLSGCSSSNSAITAPVQSPDVGTYVVTVTGTYTSSSNVVTSHSTSITFTVN